ARAERGRPGYQTYLLKAAVEFAKTKDANIARQSIARVRGNPTDHTWRLSHAFLHAYEGHLGNAEGEYERAFENQVAPQAILESETFIQDLLEEEPSKAELWFCLGIINEVGKKDRKLAKESYSKFLDHAGDRYSSQRQRAQSCIDQGS
ncbi:MAG: hypothetical protein M3N59_03535, partial [bacterium]|nr:hypothetical protein [bacterium]